MFNVLIFQFMKKVVFFIKWVNKDGRVLISHHYIPLYLRNYFIGGSGLALWLSPNFYHTFTLVSFFLESYSLHPDWYPDSSMCDKFYLRLYHYRINGWLLHGFSIRKKYLL